MEPERWRRIEVLYHSALEREPTERSSYLAAACGDDGDLRDEVVCLLAQSGLTIPLDESIPPSSLEEREGTRSLPAIQPGEILGHYRIAGLLGEGGMGRVYRAMDTRLGRAVAIKVSAEEFSNRFEREARAISALNHPHICTLHDIGMLSSGGAYLVTELVEGQTLRDWLRGSPSAERRIEAARQILEALRAAHGAGIVHRDLKPANIMVRFDGYVKVLDFGLAKRISGLGGPVKSNEAATAESTASGRIIGTVAYMSPEQILGQELDSRSDLFAFGIILYEMMTGQHPWPHEVTVERLHAILKDPTPPLESPWAGVLDKLLRKNREERYVSAEEVLDVLAHPASLPAPPETKLTRLIVLPFRILRPHGPSDFLSLALPDAITTSLAAIDSLLVRSSMVAAQLASVAFDVRTISERAQVDAILTGSILSDGENLRVNTQLVKAPDGELIWSNAAEVSLRDIFRLQDNLVDRIVQGLAVPLTAREQRALKHDVPMSAIAYEFYLRGNQIAAGNSFDPRMMSLARDLYLRSVEEDRKYAPAWACLGRAYRLIGKYGGEVADNIRLAEGAFRQAFTLHPDLAMAHNYYAALETETRRSVDALTRLIKQAQNRRNDPNLLAGLVQTCRYCDLLGPSLAAHRLAKQLDPNVRTSVAYTYLRLGEFQDALDHSFGPADCVVLPALMGLGNKQDALANTYEVESLVTKEYFSWVLACRATIEGDIETGREAIGRAMELLPFQDTDPEAAFDVATLLTTLEEPERALQVLSSALDQGYHCHYALLHDPGLEPLRSDTRFTNLLNRASEMSRRTRAVFLDNGGDRLLGVSSS
jgi:eukaryotic-like serine/threonine-protein kinase